MGTVHHPKLYSGKFEILNISLEGYQFTYNSPIAYDCYNKLGSTNHKQWVVSLFRDAPFKFSNNTVFTAIGWDTEVFTGPLNDKIDATGCVSLCSDLEIVSDNSCSGIGCCQASIPPGLKNLTMRVHSFENHSQVLGFNPCSYAFMVDKVHFKFSKSDLFNNSTYGGDHKKLVPVVVDWATSNQTCISAKGEPKNFACISDNSSCHDSANGLGYRCKGDVGYRGNPYLTGGCRGNFFECI